jgi:PRD domain protein (TIGR03582 family)
MQETISKEFQAYIEKSKYEADLKQVAEYTTYLINQYKLRPNHLQLTILGNHLSEMVDRAEQHKKLDSVDESIFNKVSQQSLLISQKIVDFISQKIGKLSDSEKYVLSIHFENMLLN